MSMPSPTFPSPAPATARHTTTATVRLRRDVPLPHAGGPRECPSASESEQSYVRGVQSDPAVTDGPSLNVG